MIKNDEYQGKNYFTTDPLVKYRVDLSCKLHPMQDKLVKASLEHPDNEMLGATDVIQTCTVLMKQAHAKNVLDVGLFTGLSALSWALAVPDDGRVISMDIDDKAYKDVGKRYVEESGLAHKIDIRIQPALKTLDELIASGQSGKFDFAFLDADKREYPQYYEKCLQLLRPGGFIAVDNAFWDGLVLQNEKDANTKAIAELNEIISSDERVNNILLPVGDGLHLAFKK